MAGVEATYKSFGEKIIYLHFHNNNFKVYQ